MSRNRSPHPPHPQAAHPIPGARFAFLVAASLFTLACGAADSTVGLASGQPADVAITFAAVDEPVQAEPTSLTLEVGEDAELSAVVLNALGQPVGSASVSWGSTDAAVVTVTDGAVSAVGAGSAEIVATVGEVFSSLPVQVTAPPESPVTK